MKRFLIGFFWECLAFTIDMSDAVWREFGEHFLYDMETYTKQDVHPLREVARVIGRGFATFALPIRKKAPSWQRSRMRTSLECMLDKE